MTEMCRYISEAVQPRRQLAACDRLTGSPLTSGLCDTRIQVGIRFRMMRRCRSGFDTISAWLWACASGSRLHLALDEVGPHMNVKRLR